MDDRVPNTKIAEALLTRPEGATMKEIKEATGDNQYNVLTRLEARNFVVRRVKEGATTRYFAEPPAAPSYEVTVTSKGQITIPMEVRKRLGVRAGGKLRLAVEADDRVVVTPIDLSIRRLFGVLGKPERSLTLEEMDETVRRVVAEKRRPRRR